MKKRTPAQALRSTCTTAVVAAALELILRHAFAARDTVAVLFAGGGSADRGVVTLALGFVLLRLFVYLVLPGLVVRDAVHALLARRPDPSSGPA